MIAIEPQVLYGRAGFLQRFGERISLCDRYRFVFRAVNDQDWRIRFGDVDIGEASRHTSGCFA